MIMRSRAKSAMAAGEARGPGPLEGVILFHAWVSKEKTHTALSAPNPPNTIASCRLRSKTIVCVHRGDGPAPGTSIQPPTVTWFGAVSGKIWENAMGDKRKRTRKAQYKGRTKLELYLFSILRRTSAK